MSDVKRTLGVITGAIVVLGAAWWLARPAVTVTIENLPSQGVAAEPGTHLDETPPLGEVALGSESAPPELFARRLPVVPDIPADGSKRPSTDERDVTAENIAPLVAKHFEHALDGDMASAYFVMRSRNSCDRVASTPEELDKQVRHVNARARSLRERGYDFSKEEPYDHPWTLNEDDGANQANLERWYSACQQLRGIYTPDLRRELELLALKGHVMARYIYAMWPEDVLHAETAFDQQYFWEERAREFSRANMEAGEVAGLLAFGQSYMTGMFTAQNRDFALGFGLAAVNCGFETLSVRSFLADNIERMTASEKPEDRQRLEFVITMSDNVGRFCGP